MLKGEREVAVVTKTDCKTTADKKHHKQQRRFSDRYSKVHGAQRTRVTQLELLANELLLDLFEYFDAVHLLRAFSGLNFRFNALLYRHFRAFHLDLRHISKQNFDTLCQQHLLSIVDRTLSLQLANDEETPGLPQLFLFRGFRLHQFIHLRSLSLHAISPLDLKKLFGKIDRLTQLIYLKLSRCNIFFDQDKFCLINQIWSLPKLIHFNLLGYSHIPNTRFTELRVISSTLERLSIWEFDACPLNDMVHLLQHTPHLRVLSMQVRSTRENEIVPVVATSIVTLNLEFAHHLDVLTSLLQSIPNLCHLTIRLYDSYFTGYKWKQIIINYLPQLKVLRFKMYVHLSYDRSREEQIDELLDTFRTPFWLVQHQWHVRYDWHPSHMSRCGHLYTVPYAFDTFNESQVYNRRSKWTCPSDKKYLSFSHVHDFTIDISSQVTLDLIPASFPNIHHLKIPHSLLDKIWYVAPTFRHLTSLCVSIYGEHAISHLQALFNEAPRLYKLCIYYSDRSPVTILCRLRSASIRYLRFLPNSFSGSFRLDNEECNTLIKSSLGRQCEILDIYIKSRRSVLNLATRMTNLRAMTIYFKSYQAETEYVEWIRNHLPARYSVNSCTSYLCRADVQLWIG